MKSEIITLSVEMSLRLYHSATPGRSMHVWGIGRSIYQELFIREIYSGSKEWIYTKFGDYRRISKI